MSDWIKGSAPIPKHNCDYVDCESPDIRFVLHETGAIWRCCFNCFQKARAVNKAKHAKDVSATWAEYGEAKSKWYERKRHEWEVKSAEREREIAERRAMSLEFYNSREWIQLRFRALAEHFKRYGHRCRCCHRKHVELHVDHIKPRSKFPELALEQSNLQVLCKECNLGKSNTDDTDFRPDGPEAGA